MWIATCACCTAIEDDHVASTCKIFLDCFNFFAVMMTSYYKQSEEAEHETSEYVTYPVFRVSILRVYITFISLPPQHTCCARCDYFSDFNFF